MRYGGASQAVCEMVAWYALRRQASKAGMAKAREIGGIVK